MKYAQSYKDWKKRLSRKNVAKGASKAVSVFAIIAIVGPFLFPLAVSAETLEEIPAPIVETVVQNTDTPDGAVLGESETKEEVQNTEEEAIVPTPLVVDEQIVEPAGPAVIYAHKVVCNSEADLPNWGDVALASGEPVAVNSTTASNFVSDSEGRCRLESNWSFQYGFAEKDGTSGVHKLPGNHIGQADGTSTMGECPPRYCGNNTFTGTDYNDWKNFDTATSNSGNTPAMVEVPNLEGAPGIWVRENLKKNYIPYSYPPDEVPGSDVSAEMYCHVDINNYDNYDEAQGVVLGEDYYCIAFNASSGPKIEAYKIVCLTESDLPNWGDVAVSDDEPVMITATTASDFVANSDQQCELQEDWSFQYGFAEKDGTSGVHKLPGGLISEADGTSTMGECPPRYCGNNTFTGTDYNDWKTFDTSTSANGVVAAMVTVGDLEGAPGIWVRENLQDGYVAFTYPPDEVPGSNVSAEIYCHVDIQNFDNYDEIQGAVNGETYYCVAFNALEEKDGGENPDDTGSISGEVFFDANQDGVKDEGEETLSGWTAYLDSNDDNALTGEERSDETSSPYVIDNLDAGTYTVRLVLQDGYTQTYPLEPDEHTVTLAVNEDETGWDFGVYSQTPPNGNGGSSRGSSRSFGRVLDSTTPEVPPVVTSENPGTVAGASVDLTEGRTLPRTGIALSFMLISGLTAAAIVFKKK